MRLTQEAASEIASRARLVLNRAIVVTDAHGIAIGGAADGFLGKTLVDALRACQEGRVVRATFDESPVAWCPFVYENRTIGSFGVIEQEVQVTPEAVNLLQGLAEVITHQYFLMEHVQPSDNIRAKFLRQVLTAPNIDIHETYREADILQLNLRTPQAIILVEVEGLEKSVAGKSSLSTDEKNQRVDAAASGIRDTIDEAFKKNSENIISYFGQDTFLISKGIGGDGLTTRNTIRFLIEKAEYIHDIVTQAYPDKIVSTGVGQYYPDLGGLRKSFQEAKLSLQVGTRVWGPGRVYHIKQVGMFVTLANVAQERKAELAHQILYPLLKDEQLYKTVQTFLSSGLNLTEAAEKLHVHRNTLIYRLDKTKKVIGLDPRVFDDALQIKLGLMFYQEA